MAIEEIRGKLNSMGSIKVTFEPSSYDENKIQKKNLQDILQKSKVSLRGWDFPHIPNRNDDNSKKPYFITGNGIEFYSNWRGIIEMFRFYSSGQFLAKVGLREDTIGKFNDIDFDANKYLDFLTVIYKVTEICIFTKNLIENTGIEGGTLTIEISNTKDRKLDSLFSPTITPFYENYISGMPKITAFKKFNREKILTNTLEISRELIGDIFTDFNWTNYSEQMIQTHQEKLINRRI